MKKMVLLLSLISLIIGVGVAQNKVVSGTVISADDNMPVIGATVRAKSNAKFGALTNAEGKFKFEVPSSETKLLISYVGMAAKEVAVGTNIKVVLYAQSEQLDEIVVTALGIKRQKRDLGYSTVKLDDKELNQAKAVNITTGLQGKVPGLNIASLNSGVFEDVKISMRGIRSLTGNNNPMLLLDGVPVGLSYLSSLNPNDVKTLDILKGSSAAAIYGPDARNGVIVVTTKSGGNVEKPQITFSSSIQASSISFFPKFQEEFGSGSGGVYIPYENESWGLPYDGVVRQLGKPDPEGNIQEYPYSPIHNNRKDFFNTGLVIQNDLSIASKGFYLSAQDASITGILPGDKNRRTGLRMSANREFGKLSASFNANYIQHNSDVFSSGAMSGFYGSQDIGMHAGIMDLVFATQAWVPLTDFKLNNKWGEYNYYYNEYSLNPYQAIDTWRSKYTGHDLITNLNLNYKITDWLEVNYRAALTLNVGNSKSITKQVVPSEWAKSNRAFKFIPQGVSESMSLGTRISSEPFITASKEFGDFKLSGILGSYLRVSKGNDISVSASPLIINGLYNISARSGEPGASHGRSEIRMFSWYGSLSVGYKNFLNVEVTGRQDKTSVLAPENNSFFYPGVSASLVLTDAIPGLKSEYINFFKLRASWNKTGNADIGAYSLQPIYYQTSGFPYDGLPGYSARDSYTDPKLKPEFINSSEFGFEAAFIKNRVNVDFTYYDQKNTNQIISIRTPRPTGWSFARVNAASFRNYGMEASLRLTPLVRLGEVNFNFTFNYAYNNSKILSIYQNLDEIVIAGYYAASNSAVLGQPAFIINAKDYKRDPKGRVIVNKNTGIPEIEENPKHFGRTMPLHTVGLAPTFRWRGLTVSSVFEYKGGHYTFNIQGSTMAWDGQSRVTAANHRERFVFPNSVYEVSPGKFEENKNITVYENYGFFHGDNYRNVGTNMLFSAAAWRWRELSVSYSLPQNWLSFQNYVKGVDVAFTGRNLILWLPKSNEWSDPDFSVYGGNVGSIVNSSINPPIRTLGGSITVKF